MAKSNAERQKAYRARQKQKSMLPAAPEKRRLKAERHSNGRIKAVTEEEFDRWLELIASGYSTLRAVAERMGHNQDALLDWRKRSDENERRYQVAFQAGTNVLADESTRRGLEGYYETHTNKDGEIIRKVHKYDSRHLELQLKRRDPEAYRDNYVAGGTQPIQIVFHNPFAAVAPEADITLEPVELPQLPAPKEEDDARTTQP